MNDYNFDDGGGCLSLPGLALAAMVMVFLLSIAGGDDTTTNTANVEALSRNQVNLWSDVTNCYGDYSCMTVTSTESTRTDITTTAGGDVQYRDGGIVFGDGVLRCWDVQTGGYTAEACASAQAVTP